MIKELKYFLYVLTIILFTFFSVKYYFSDTHKKKSYRSIQSNEEKIVIYSENLPVLKNDTDNIVEYVKNINNESKKKYHFWELLFNDEK